MIARRTGVPLVIIPISHENPAWVILDTKFFMPLFERLPFGSENFSRYNWRGWESTEKNKSPLETGDIFVAVTLGRNWQLLCNAEALIDLFQEGLISPKQPCGISFACAS